MIDSSPFDTGSQYQPKCTGFRQPRLWSNPSKENPKTAEKRLESWVFKKHFALASARKLRLKLTLFWQILWKECLVDRRTAYDKRMSGKRINPIQKCDGYHGRCS
jgi:hypothetical protein